MLTCFPFVYETIEDRRLKRREEIGDTYPIPASRFADRRPYRRNSPKRHPRDEDRGNRRRSRSRSRDRDRNSRRYDDRSHRNRDREPYRDRDRERDRRERR
ncbi:unnamed protein product [Auanema sp. JU1783]|nr:unnamed protein product [Auanema sp. JU1783]